VPLCQWTLGDVFYLLLPAYSSQTHQKPISCSSNEKKNLKKLNGSERMAMHFWTASSRCRGCLCLAVAQSTFCTFGDGRAAVFRPSRRNRLVPHHDMSSDPSRVAAKSKHSDLVDDTPFSNGPPSKRCMSWLLRGSSGEKMMGMDDGQSTRPHQGDRHVMTRQMWVLGQPLRCPMSELLLCTPAGRRASCRATACPRQEGV